MRKIFSASALRLTLLTAATLITLYFGLYAHFFPDSGIPAMARGYGDRNLHIAAFAVLSFLAMIGGSRRGLALLAVIGFAVVLESAQIWLPNRSANWLDLLASLAGIALGASLAWLAGRRRRPEPFSSKDL